MKLKFIGRGGAFAPMSIGQSNMFFEHNDKRMLLDCGTTAPYILRDELGINPLASEFDSIYISHMHDDHVGGLSFLALYNYFLNVINGGTKYNLYIHHSLVDDVWEHIKRGVDTLQGIHATIDTYFNVYSIMDNGMFEWEGYKFETVQTLHVVSERKFMNSYGLIVSSANGISPVTFITTDTQFTHPCPLQTFYDKADVIFHDCEIGFKSGVHAAYDDMNEHLDQTTRSKMWLYHYNGEPSVDVREAGFAGLVEKGQEFNIC